MKSEKLRIALASVIGRIREIGPDAFRAELEKQENGDIASALREIEAFASFYVTDFFTVHSAVNTAIMWGAALNQPFEIIDLENFIAANDSNFALAA